MHMNAIGRDFKSFQTQILAEIDKEFSHIFDSGLNLHHKNSMVKVYTQYIGCVIARFLVK